MTANVNEIAQKEGLVQMTANEMYAVLGALVKGARGNLPEPAVKYLVRSLEKALDEEQPDGLWVSEDLRTQLKELPE
jgi:hypothetical protein